MRETISIKEHGPVHRFSFQVDSEGGLWEALGENGVGKSKTLEAISAAVEGGSLVANDEATEGKVEAFGVELRFSRRTTRSGELVATTIGGGILWTFVDGGNLRDPERADLERAKALCVMGKIAVDLVAVAEALGIDVDGLRALAKERSLRFETVPEVAYAVKRDIEEAARAVEETAKKAESDAEAIRKLLPEFDPGIVHDEAELAADSERAVRALATAEAEERAARTARASGEAAKKALDAIGPLDPEDLRADLANANASVSAAETEAGKFEGDARYAEAVEALQREGLARDETADELRKAEELVQVLRERLGARDLAHEAALRRAAAAKREVLGERQAALSAARDRRSAAERALEACQKALADREAAREAVRRASESADPEEKAREVAEARQRVERARKAVQDGAVLRTILARVEEADSLKRVADQQAAEAKRLRDLASACEEVVTKAIQKVAPRGMRFRRGRLVVPTERGPETPFAELSKGERTKLGIDVVVDALGEGPEGTRPVLVIPQELNEGLDPIVRADVAKHLRSRKAVGISARATLGELRVEEFSGA